MCFSHYLGACVGGWVAPKGSRAQPGYAVFPPQQLKNGLSLSSSRCLTESNRICSNCDSGTQRNDDSALDSAWNGNIEDVDKSLEICKLKSKN